MSKRVEYCKRCGNAYVGGRPLRCSAEFGDEVCGCEEFGEAPPLRRRSELARTFSDKDRRILRGIGATWDDVET